MATSGTISTTTFNTLKVVDQAFRRCRLNAEQISSEMQDYAKDVLYLQLSELANGKTPSWCIQKQIYPFYEGQPDITLDVGTVEVLNANYRTLQEVTGSTTTTSTSYTVDFTTDTVVNTVGVKWSAAAVTITLQVSSDGSSWTTVGTQTTAAASGAWTWTDISGAVAYRYFRFTAGSAISYSEVFLGNTPSEIPMGSLNRDTYVAQSNKVFTGRPTTYWFQRDRSQPVFHTWPAPNSDAEHAQLIIWRHRHIMDVGTLQQEIEVPQRWLEAIIAGLAARVAAETPTVDINLISTLEQKYTVALQKAWDGDNDGSPTFFQPRIGVYTR